MPLVVLARAVFAQTPDPLDIRACTAIDNDAQRANGILQNLLEFARPPDVEQELLEFNQVVIFVKSVARATELDKLLVSCNFPSISIHSGLPQE